MVFCSVSSLIVITITNTFSSLSFNFVKKMNGVLVLLFFSSTARSIETEPLAITLASV